MQYPVRKTLIKKKREEAQNRKQQQEQQDKSYAAVTRLEENILRMKGGKQETVCNLNVVTLLKVLLIAHLTNVANPGFFGRTVRELLRQMGCCSKMPHQHKYLAPLTE